MLRRDSAAAIQRCGGDSQNEFWPLCVGKATGRLSSAPSIYFDYAFILTR
jgi:hypothetical protein